MTRKPVSTDDLLREVKRLAAEEAAIKRRKRALSKKLTAAAESLVAEDTPTRPKRRYVRRHKATRTERPAAQTTRPLRPPTAKGEFRSDVSWTATVLKKLTEAGRPIKYSELKEVMAQTHLGAKLRRSDKSFYGALLKLERMDLAVRHGGRISTKAVYQRFMRDVAAGTASDEIVRDLDGGSRSPIKRALFAFLKTRSEGAPVAEIIEALAENPELNINNNRYRKTVVYNLIAKLVRRAELVRNGKVIRLPQPSNGGMSKNDMPSVTAH